MPEWEERERAWTALCWAGDRGQQSDREEQEGPTVVCGNTFKGRPVSVIRGLSPATFSCILLWFHRTTKGSVQADSSPRAAHCGRPAACRAGLHCVLRSVFRREQSAPQGAPRFVLFADASRLRQQTVSGTWWVLKTSLSGECDSLWARKPLIVHDSFHAPKLAQGSTGVA